MGLDWVVEPKEKNSNVSVEPLNARIASVRESIDERWKAFYDSQEPVEHPNDFRPLQDAFNSMPDVEASYEELEQLHKQLESLMVYPAETIKAPRIGIDPEADEWVVKNWENVQPEGTSLEEFLAESHGHYVAEAVTDCPGIPPISGFLTSPTSFRGKAVCHVSWLNDTLRHRAYTDHNPRELVEYGELLCKEALSQDPKTQSPKSIELVKSAGDWCKFWGSHGHGMHAWY